jgi:hypothetical protein
MHSANGAFLEGAGNTMLRKISFEAVCLEFVYAKRAREKAATVMLWLNMNKPCAAEAGSLKPHD